MLNYIGSKSNPWMYRLIKMLGLSTLALTLYIPTVQPVYAAPSNVVLCEKLIYRSQKPVKWRNNSANFNVSDALWGDKQKRNAILDASYKWSKATAVKLKINFSVGDGDSMRYGNGVSEIYYGALLPNELGRTMRSKTNSKPDNGRCYFKEVDIVIDSFSRFTPSPEDGRDVFRPPYNFNLVFAHELGHGLGLKHNNSKLSLMNEAYPFGGHTGKVNATEPRGVDQRKLRQMYGIGGRIFDVAASHWQRGISDSRIAQPIKLLRPTGSPHPREIQIGQEIAIPYSIHNLGTGTKSVHVRFYMSKDRNKVNAAGGIKIGDIWHTMSGASDLSGRKLSVIPVIDEGEYYFGYQVSAAISSIEQRYGLFENDSVVLNDKYYISEARSISASGINLFDFGDGWWQIQRASDYKEVYQGTTKYVPLPPDSYNVINLTTGSRYKNVRSKPPAES